MKSTIRVICTAALVALAACSSQKSSEPTQFDIAKQAFLSVFGGFLGRGDEPGVPLSQSLTREQIATSPTPLILASVPATGGQALMAPLLNNGQRQTWGSNDGITVTFVNSVVVATRGLGYDLMGADTDGVFQTIAAGGGSFVRIHDVLNGLGEVERLPYACELTIVGSETVEVLERAYATTKVSEVCRGGEIAFENGYWIEADGTVRKSQQWINDNVRYLVIERLL